MYSRAYTHSDVEPIAVRSCPFSVLHVQRKMKKIINIDPFVVVGAHVLIPVVVGAHTDPFVMVVATYRHFLCGRCAGPDGRHVRRDVSPGRAELLRPLGGRERDLRLGGYRCHLSYRTLKASCSPWHL